MLFNFKDRKSNIINKGILIDQKLMESRTLFQRIYFILLRQFSQYYFLPPPQWKIFLRAISSEIRMKPSFILIGSVRSGTTSLSSYIMKHPCVVLPISKEIVLSKFQNPRNVWAYFPSGSQEKNISNRHGKAITGLSSPLLPSISFPFLASALADNLKIIFILRNPVDRAFAHWRWDQVLLSEFLGDPLWKNYPSFDEIIQIEIEYAREQASTSGFATGGMEAGYIQHSLYYPFVKRCFDYFKFKDSLFINSDEYFSNPQKTVQEIFSFLDLPPFEIKNDRVVNSAPKSSMSKETREYLTNYFNPYTNLI